MSCFLHTMHACISKRKAFPGWNRSDRVDHHGREKSGPYNPDTQQSGVWTPPAGRSIRTAVRVLINCPTGIVKGYCGGCDRDLCDDMTNSILVEVCCGRHCSSVRTHYCVVLHLRSGMADVQLYRTRLLVRNSGNRYVCYSPFVSYQKRISETVVVLYCIYSIECTVHVYSKRQFCEW